MRGIDLGHHGDREIRAGLVDLAVNVRAGTPPAWLASRVREADLAAYPDQRRARAAVARRHGRTEEEVLLTAGAAEAFVLIARAIAPELGAVVHPQFTEPEAALRAAGHRVDRVMLGGNFELAPDAVPDAADLVMIGNPTNPTSVLHPAALLAKLARPGRTLIVDEAFMDCVPGEPASLVARRDLPGLVVIRSLTKTWGLAGLRAGYVLAESEIIERLARAQPLWPVSAPALVAIEACVEPAALAGVERWAAELAVERARLAARLTDLGIHVVPGSRASFLCLNLPDAMRVRATLRDRGYAVRRGDTFPGLGEDWLRIAVRSPETNDTFLTALEKSL